MEVDSMAIDQQQKKRASDQKKMDPKEQRELQMALMSDLRERTGAPKEKGGVVDMVVGNFGSKAFGESSVTHVMEDFSSMKNVLQDAEWQKALPMVLGKVEELAISSPNADPLILSTIVELASAELADGRTAVKILKSMSENLPPGDVKEAVDSCLGSLDHRM